MNKYEKAIEHLKENVTADNVDDIVMFKKLLTEFKDCRNELCYHCGSYTKAHLGACEGCRWK